MIKSYLKLAKEFQGRSFDMLVAHTTIVFLRYIMITEARVNKILDELIASLPQYLRGFICQT